VGKPENMLFVEGLRRLHATAAHTLVIGDNPLTDANGAVRMGMRYLLVGRHELADAGSPAQLLQLAHEGHAQAPAAHRSVAAGHAPSSRVQYRLIDSTSKVRRKVSTDLS
jgi:FMN phosphatase YigB (HAD superfamily)